MLRIATTTDRNAKKILCNCCSLPFAVIRNKLLIIESRHAGVVHPNGLTADDLRNLANELERCAKMAQDKVA